LQHFWHQLLNVKKFDGRQRSLAAVLCFSTFLGASTCRSSQKDKSVSPEILLEIETFASEFTISDTSFQGQLKEFTETEHPFNSARQKKLSEYIKRNIEKHVTKASIVTFNTKIPNRALLATPNAPASATLDAIGYNVVGIYSPSSVSECAIVIGSHYDTKILDDSPYLGANDSGSSSILLMQLAEFFNSNSSPVDLRCDFIFVWFDGEESVLPGWNDAEHSHPAKMVDHTYGSQNFVDSLTDCQAYKKAYKCLPESLGGRPIIATVIIDMIGDPDLKITKEMFSSTKLRNLLSVAATSLGYKAILGDYKEVADDHIPFVNAGISSLNIIDFNNLTHWHKPTDTPDNISSQSIEIVGKITTYILLNISSSPQVFAGKAD
jgi:glutaminyl-peptide cyclotransferase